MTQKTKKTKKSEFIKVQPNLSLRGQIVYIEDKSDAVPYLVIDIGSPYILIEDTISGFATLYHFTNLYQKK